MGAFRACLGFICLVIAAQRGYASEIGVNPLEVDLNAQTRYEDIQVSNVGNDTAYVKIEVARINNPGLPTQVFIPLKDNPYQIGLIVTPSKLVVPVGQTRLVRVLYVGKPVAADILYRVRIAPVTGQLVALSSGGKQLDAGVQLVVAYGVAVYVRPVDLQPKVVAVRQGTVVNLTNSGNTSVLITSCQQCQSGKTHCQALPNLVERLFPGGTAHYILPQNLPVHCLEEVTQGQLLPFNIN